jgi:hypothetical protein
MVKAGIVDGNLLLKLNIGISAWAAFANLMGIYLTSEWGRRAMFRAFDPYIYDSRGATTNTPLSSVLYSDTSCLLCHFGDYAVLC